MLVKCPECRRLVSSKADKCPHCGYPINDPPAKKPREAEEGCLTGFTNCGCAVLYILFLIFGLLLLFH